ncbi:hypothetical protein COU53_01440 [Candidatus Pacearchaeota archaeon CG10_big_fil_rev_8_21_14_0_10_30_48]|nr:MAG: hypothetical protein COU53_01440 [Candidatus Pacearchaeota archaeon CG10_big_fil_rev_8_21_14_0_10_30_48]
METKKAIMILTAVFIVIAIVYGSVSSDIMLSPGEDGAFVFSWFYVVLFVLWTGIAVFIIIRNKKQSKEIKNKVAIKSGKKVDVKEIEKNIEARLEKKLNSQVKKEVIDKTKNLKK